MKIKKIELNNFRGFKGRKEIDLDDADIVVVHGLNGFGKTSIFDSIEWALTGRLARYDKYLKSGYKQGFKKESNVLRSKYADDTETFSKVHLTDGTKIGRYLPLNLSESDYCPGESIEGFDYGISRITKGSVAEDKTNDFFSSTHLLSQEQINKFITSKTPDERYNAVSVNFGTNVFNPFRENQKKALSILTSKLKELDSELKIYEKSIKDLSKQKAVNDEKKQTTLKEIKLVLSKLEKPILNDSLEDISVKPSQILKEVRQKLLDFNSKLDKSIAQEKELFFLKEKYSEWKEKNSILSELKKELRLNSEKKEKALVTIRSVETASKNSITLEKNVGEIEKLLRELTLWDKNLDKILEEKKKKDELESKALETAKKLEKSLKSLEHAENNVLKRDIQVERISELLSEFDKTEKSLENLNGKGSKELLSELKRNLKTTKEKYSVEAKRYGGISSAGSLILSDMESGQKVDEVAGELISHDLKEDFTTLNFVIKKNNGLRQQIDDLEVRVKKLKDDREEQLSLLSQHQKLLTESLDIVLKIKSDKTPCPVCETEHPQDSLLNVIKLQLSRSSEELFSKKTNEINSKVKMLELLKKESYDQKKVVFTCLERIKSTQNKYVLTLKQELSVLEDRLKRVDEVVREKGLIFKMLEALRLSLAETTGISLEKKDFVGDVNSYLLELRNALREDKETVKKSKSSYSLDSKRIKSIKSELNLVANGDNYSSLQEIGKRFSYTSKSDLEKKIKTAIEKNTDLVKNAKSDLKKQLNIIGRYGDLKTLRSELEQAEKHIIHNRNETDSIENWLNSYRKVLDHESIAVDKATKRIIEKRYKELTLRLASLRDEKQIYSSVESLLVELKTLEKFEPLERELTSKGVKEESIKSEIIKLNAKKAFLSELKKDVPRAIKAKINENLDPKLFEILYKNLNPHQRFSRVKLDVSVKNNNIGLGLTASESGVSGKPEYLFSSAQLNTLGVCIFLSMALRQNWLKLDTLLLDDPVQNLDDINILSLIDLIRVVVEENGKQIFISTHDERLYNLLNKKLSGFKCKFINFSSYGKMDITST